MSSHIWVLFVLAACAPDPVGGTISAMSSAHDLQATFEPDGVWVSGRSGEAPPIQIALRSWGRAGALEPGEFAKHNGKLIQKLAFAEFEPVYKEYMGLASHYIQGLDRGDTVNDLVVKLIREHAAKLILTSPV